MISIFNPSHFTAWRVLTKLVEENASCNPTSNRSPVGTSKVFRAPPTASAMPGERAAHTKEMLELSVSLVRMFRTFSNLSFRRGPSPERRRAEQEEGGAPAEDRGDEEQASECKRLSSYRMVGVGVHQVVSCDIPLCITSSHHYSPGP